MCYTFDSDTITLVNPLDKKPISEQYIVYKQKYIQGGVNVIDETLFVRILFRIINTTER